MLENTVDILIRFDEQIVLRSSLLARSPMNVNAMSSQRSFIMDKRGEGVPIILTVSQKFSGIKPKYELLDDAELVINVNRIRIIF